MRLSTWTLGHLKTPLLGLAALTLPLLIALPSASAAEPAPPAAGAEGQELQGKNAFSLDQLEGGGLWDANRRKSEIKKSEARRRKIDGLMKLVNDPAYPNKADALFRLAETWWKEEKFDYFMAREKYEAAYACFEEKRCTAEPEEPVENHETSIGFYRKVLLADPNYRRLDTVTYFLGRAAIEAGKAKKDRQLEKEGEQRLKDVVQRYPKSNHVPASHLTLAEYYFDRDSLYYAKTNYEKIITNFPNNAMYNYALYKLGWVYFNLAEFEKTVDTFHKVISRIKGEGGDGIIEFRAQALNDLVQTYAELDNGWQMAKDYFMAEVGEKDTYDKLEKMAALLVSKDRDEEAIELYHHMIAHDRVASKNVEFYDATMEVHRKLGDMVATEGEINDIVAFFDHKGQWFTANQSNDTVTKQADELVSTNLIFMANHYHRAAQKNDEKRRAEQAKGEYASATKYYKQFLDRYPDHEESYKLNFYYAEILFHELGEYMLAAEQYEKVLDKDTKGEFVEDAALGVIFAVEGELVKLGLKEKGDEKVSIVKLDDNLRSEEDEKPIPLTELHPLEKRYINAADKYVEVLSDALKDEAFRKKYPKRGKKIPNIMFIAAQTFYKHGQFKDAVARLQVIFDLYPKHEMANHAVNTIIDAYKRLKRWEKIEYWARELIRTKNFIVKKKPELEQIIAIAKTEHAKDLTRQRKFDDAVRVQQEIVNEFGRKNKDVAAKALFNIGAIHEIARRFPEAVDTYERVIKQYKTHEVAVEAQAAIGILYESQTEFRKAAEAFVGMQQFKARFKKNEKARKRAADAYRDAGLLYEALGEFDEAHKVFTNYTKLYPKRDDVPKVAFASAQVLEHKGTPESFEDAAKAYGKVATKHGRKDKEYKLRATVASGLAYKAADKDKNRRKAEKAFKAGLKEWTKFVKAAAKAEVPEPEVETSTKAYAARSSFELAEYTYDDYAALNIKAVNKRGDFDIKILASTLTKKAEALLAAEKGFDKVLAFKDKGMAAAAAFRLGQILYEFAESLFNAPVPPGLTPEQVDEYRFFLEEKAGPIQERALAAFTAALKQAVKDGVYNKWSRLSAIFAAKVNPDEFPIAEFTVKPDKTIDTIESTSFIKSARRGSEVVDYLRSEKLTKDKDAADEGDDAKADEAKKEGDK